VPHGLERGDRAAELDPVQRVRPGQGHVPMLSHPDFVLDVIRTAANSI
jgi:hypothetical protein